jgi:hypothetical protein
MHGAFWQPIRLDQNPNARLEKNKKLRSRGFVDDRKARVNRRWKLACFETDMERVDVAKSSGKSFTPPLRSDEMPANMARSWPPEP